MDKLCPLMKKSCIEHGCRWWTNVQGRDPQTSEVINKWACAVELLPILQITVAQEMRQGAAATESLRNETVNAAGALARGVANGISEGLERAAVVAAAQKRLAAPGAPQLEVVEGEKRA